MEQEKLTQLPIARIRTVMKTSPAMRQINQEALYLMCRAAEMFIEYMATHSHITKSKSLEYKHLAECVEREERLEFLQPILPKKITVKQYKWLMESKNGANDDSDSDDDEEEEAHDTEQKNDGEVSAAESEDSASSSGDSGSIITVDSSSDEKENSKNINNKKTLVKHKTGDSP